MVMVESMWTLKAHRNLEMKNTLIYEIVKKKTTSVMDTI